MRERRLRHRVIHVFYVRWLSATEKAKQITAKCSIVYEPDVALAASQHLTWFLLFVAPLKLFVHAFRSSISICPKATITKEKAEAMFSSHSPNSLPRFYPLFARVLWTRYNLDR